MSLYRLSLLSSRLFTRDESDNGLSGVQMLGVAIRDVLHLDRRTARVMFCSLAAGPDGLDIEDQGRPASRQYLRLV